MRTRVPALVRKEFCEIRRDLLTMWVIVVLPLVLLFLFGHAISLDVEDVTVAVVDGDRTAESGALVDAFVNTGHFVVRHRLDDVRPATRLLDNGTARLVLVIPRGFAHDLESGRTATVQTLIDGSFSARAAVIRNEVDAVTASFTARRLGRGSEELERRLGGGIEARVWYNPSLRSATFVVPGMLAVILMAFPPLLTVLAIVREKESGSIEQVYVSPLRRWEFLAGKMLPYVAIAFAEFALLLALAVWWFRVPLKGSIALLSIAAGLYVLCTVGIGILVSTLTRSQVVAIMLATVITVMPSFLFSGFLYPISSMPLSAQLRSYIFPARYFTDISRGVFLKGTGVNELWMQMATLVGYTAVVFVLASMRFRKKVA